MFFSMLLMILTLGNADGATVKDIRTAFAEGNISGNEYTNGYFGLPTGTRARLIDVQADAANWDDKYEIAVLADLLAANPSLRSPEQYVRSVRHEMEREGLETVRTESPKQISELTFVEAVLRDNAGNGGTHYRGVYSTFLNGYVLSLDVSAASPERLERVVRDSVKFKSGPNSGGTK